MQRELIIIGIDMAIYILLAIGIGLAFYESIHDSIERIRMIRRLQARRKKEMGENQPLKDLQRFLHMALGYDLSPSLFLTFLTIIFLSTLILLQGLLGPLVSLLLSLSAVALPCLILRIRISNKRRKGSYEGVRLVTGILSEYRMHNLNIYEAIERVLASSLDLKITGKYLSKLLYELRNTGNPKKIKLASEDFSYAIDTNWGRMLAHNIYIAASKGSDVSLAIEDILIQLRDAKTASEERKRLNSEAVRMTFFMVPSIYLITLIMALTYLDVPISRYIKNQLGTSEGVLMFYFILFLFVVNIALLQLVTNRRFDY